MNSKIDIDAAIAGYQRGYSLPAEFYCHPTVFERDIEAIALRSWFYVCHESEIADVGAFKLFELAGESIIVVRCDDGSVRAHHNVCRHRGSRVCWESSGQSKSFVCPYHGWAYNLRGELLNKREMDESFDKRLFGLKPAAVSCFHGIVYVNLDPNAGDFSSSAAQLDPILRPYKLAATKVAHEQTWRVDANWKLTLENFYECYHCAPAHPEYARAHTLSLRDVAREKHEPAMLEKSASFGIDNAVVSSEESMSDDPFCVLFHTRHALFDGYVTGSEDGQAVAPLLGDVTGYDGGASDLQFSPFCTGLIYPDHMVLYSFLPVDVNTTDMKVVWLVNGDAQEGRDYDLDQLTWLWRVTTDADEAIILNNQRGVSSRFYEPGPYSTMERYTQQFVEWYLASLQSA
ncbi:MAG: aromatic ring-hydroxylating dioxygenase subunit alpha [Pseudomonadota bacterium]